MNSELTIEDIDRRFCKVSDNRGFLGKYDKEKKIFYTIRKEKNVFRKTQSLSFDTDLIDNLSIKLIKVKFEVPAFKNKILIVSKSRLIKEAIVQKFTGYNAGYFLPIANFTIKEDNNLFVY